MKKYPVIKTNFIPRGFKHCEIAYIVDFTFDGEENYLVGDDVEIKKAYLTYIKKEMLQLVDSLLVLYRPMIMGNNDMDFIALKDNTDIPKLKSTIDKLLVEATQFTKETMDISASLIYGMIMLEDKEPTMLKANRVGNLLVESDEYKNNRLRPQGVLEKESLSYVTPYSEFRTSIYNKQDS